MILSSVTCSPSRTERLLLAVGGRTPSPLSWRMTCLRGRGPCPFRCRKMTGGVTPRVARMGRSPVAGCGAAAISKPWGMRRAETQTVAPRHLPKHSPDALPPAALPAWTQPGSSKDGGGGGVGDDSEFLRELYVVGFAWVALLRVQQTSLLCSIWGWSPSLS